MEDISKRTETVRPQFGERCECQPACGSALRAKSYVNKVELNGETDDEGMENGETGFDDGSAVVRNIRDAGQPTESERREHEPIITVSSIAHRHTFTHSFIPSWLVLSLVRPLGFV